MKTVAYKNLGCKVNSYELDKVKQILTNYGFIEKKFDSPADIYIVNTCTVTHIADKKSRKMLHKAKKNNPKSIVIAMGCFVDNLKQEDDCIDIYIKNEDKLKIYEIIDKYITTNNYKFINDNIETNDNINIDIDNDNTIDYNDENDSKIRKFLKIQDGCNQYCSYCIIPYVRNKLKSKTSNEIIKEVKQYAESGIREIVLTGIHLSSYSLDFYNKKYEDVGAIEIVRQNLVDIIDKIARINDIYRIRLGSLEPRLISEKFILDIKNLEFNDKFCQEFHLSLQSGSDNILKAMNRHYNTSEYEYACNIIRKMFDDALISTDIIVGFPNESEKDFKDSLEFIKKMNIYNPHIFKYSNREGTVASKMKFQISDKEKNKRSEIFINETNEISNTIRNSYLNKIVEILVEEIVLIDNKYYLSGFTKNYIKVFTEIDNNNDNYIGKIINVIIIKAEKILYGKFV